MRVGRVIVGCSREFFLPWTHISLTFKLNCLSTRIGEFIFTNLSQGKLFQKLFGKWTVEYCRNGSSQKSPAKEIFCSRLFFILLNCRILFKISFVTWKNGWKRLELDFLTRKNKVDNESECGAWKLSYKWKLDKW